MAAFVLTGAGSLFAWFSAKHYTTDKRIANLERHYAVLTERLANMPTAREFNQLTVSLERTVGALDGLRERLGSVKHQLNLHDEWLREQDKKKAEGL